MPKPKPVKKPTIKTLIRGSDVSPLTQGMNAARGSSGRGITSLSRPPQQAPGRTTSTKRQVVGDGAAFNPNAESFRLPGPDADGNFVPGPKSIADGSTDQAVMRAAYESGFDRNFGQNFRSSARKMIRAEKGDDFDPPEADVNELAYRLALKHIDEVGSDPVMRGTRGAGSRKRIPQRGPNSVEFKDYLRSLAREEFNVPESTNAARPEPRKIKGVLDGGKQPDYSGDEDADIAQNAPNARLRRLKQISTDGTEEDVDPETGEVRLRQTSAGISDEMLAGEFEDLNRLYRRVQSGDETAVREWNNLERRAAARLNANLGFKGDVGGHDTTRTATDRDIERAVEEKPDQRSYVGAAQTRKTDVVTEGRTGMPGASSNESGKMADDLIGFLAVNDEALGKFLRRYDKRAVNRVNRRLLDLEKEIGVVSGVPSKARKLLDSGSSADRERAGEIMNSYQMQRAEIIRAVIKSLDVGANAKALQMAGRTKGASGITKRFRDAALMRREDDGVDSDASWTKPASKLQASDAHVSRLSAQEQDLRSRVQRVLEILQGIKSGKIKFVGDARGSQRSMRRADQRMEDAVDDIAEVGGGRGNARSVARDAIESHLEGDSFKLDDLIKRFKGVFDQTRTNNAERNRLAAQPGSEASVFEAIARRQGSRRVREAQGIAMMRGDPPAPRNLAAESVSVPTSPSEGGQVDRVGERTAARKLAVQSRYKKILKAIGKPEPAVVRELEALKDAGVDVSKIVGTGPKGRIEMKDIKRFAPKTPPAERVDKPGPSVNPQNQGINDAVRSIRSRIQGQASSKEDARVLQRARFDTSMKEYGRARTAGDRTQVPSEIRAVRRLQEIESKIAKIEAEIKRGQDPDQVVKVSFKNDDQNVAEPRTLESRRDQLNQLRFQRQGILDELGPRQRELVTAADRAARESDPGSPGLSPGRDARAIKGAVEENILRGQGAGRRQQRIDFLEAALRGDNDDYVIRNDDNAKTVRLKTERIQKAKAELKQLTKPSSVQFGNTTGRSVQGIPKSFDPNPRRPAPIERPTYLSGRKRGQPISSVIESVERNRNRKGRNPLVPKKKYKPRSTEMQRAIKVQGNPRVKSRIKTLIGNINARVDVD